MPSRSGAVSWWIRARISIETGCFQMRAMVVLGGGGLEATMVRSFARRVSQPGRRQRPWRSSQ
jgi:hypothetical protein